MLIMWSLLAQYHKLDNNYHDHYNDVIMGVMASQIISVSIVCSNVCSRADLRNHQSSASLALRGIHRWPVNSPHIGPVTRKMFPFDEVMLKFHEWSKVVYWGVHATVTQYFVIFYAILSSSNLKFHHVTGDHPVLRILMLLPVVNHDMSQVKEVRLSCYLVLLSFHSKTR